MVNENSMGLLSLAAAEKQSHYIVLQFKDRNCLSRPISAVPLLWGATADGMSVWPVCSLRAAAKILKVDLKWISGKNLNCAT